MASVMNFTAFEKDIDDLLDDFALCGSRSFSAFKKVWLSRKFSYLFEGRPAYYSAVFMQRLYSHCIGHIIRLGSLTRRIGGLYCLYCLYEIQPFKPPFKIYISLGIDFVGELKHLRQLVIKSKKEGMEDVAALVNRMMERKSFLFGAVDSVGCDSLKQRTDLAKRLHDKLVQAIYNKLFGSSGIEDYLQMDLSKELDLNQLKKISQDYNIAKELAITETSKTMDTGDLKGISERGDAVGPKMEEVVQRWDASRQDFLVSTGSPLPLQTLPADDFGAQLEQLLTED